MGKGIKKLTENVIADKRSLLLVGGAKKKGSNDKDFVPSNITNTEAMPLGMVSVDYVNQGMIIKTNQDASKPSDSTWQKFNAANTLADQSIITNLVKDSAITTAKINNNAVTEPKIIDSAVTTNKIKDSNVVTAKIADRAITNEKIADDAIQGRVIKDGAITTAKIAGKAVTTAKIADEAVNGAKIAPGAVSEKHLSTTSPLMIREKNIYDSSITTNKIKDGAVTNAKIANGAVTSTKIANNQIATAHLQNGSVTKDKLAPNAVGTTHIQNNSITREKLAPGAVTLDILGQNVVDVINRAVLHDGKGNVTGTNSTVLNNITATGDIYAHRVYNVVYMDIAEGYIPGEKLEAGDIVAMHEDGKVYKAATINECIVGVVSNEFANCLGASKEELFSGEKVAVGMIGKIHVKVKGPVRLGQRITVSVSDAGVGVANWMNNNNIGQALETIDCDFDEIHEVLVQVRPM
jgi:hypothetical protein